MSIPQRARGSHAYGWGIGWYPENSASATVTKDPSARGTHVVMDVLTEWSKFCSSVFLCKVLGANKGYTHTEAQPFNRTFAGRDWLFLHNGNLDKKGLEALHGPFSRLLEPVGTTDSELAFCNLLGHMRKTGGRLISDIPTSQLLAWFQAFDPWGSADMVLTDGRTLACYQGTQSANPLRHMRVQPPENQQTYTSRVAQFALDDPRDTYRTALIVSSAKFAQGKWVAMKPGQLLLIRGGRVVWSNHTADEILPKLEERTDTPSGVAPQGESAKGVSEQRKKEKVQPIVVTNARAVTTTSNGDTLSYRAFQIDHVTDYKYSTPVQRSTHLFRLQPMDDAVQEVERWTLNVSASGEHAQFEDVFGNHSIHCTIEKPFRRLVVESKCVVKIFASPPDDHSLSRRQSSIPLVWMPWQRQMMTPYLLPPELPEDQLYELTAYAMGFVERNDFQLLKTIEDINASIYADYKYVSGSTSLETTPFDVYAKRQGVCQDFANLLICVARLLGVPARYRMGYIYTGANYANKIQSDASHAWAEVYLPYVGWRGFDPTNGCMAQQDHVRVAVGRNFRDATPTSGTIYKGGGTETLKVDVKVREL